METITEPKKANMRRRILAFLIDSTLIFIIVIVMILSFLALGCLPEGTTLPLYLYFLYIIFLDPLSYVNDFFGLGFGNITVDFLFYSTIFYFFKDIFGLSFGKWVMGLAVLGKKSSDSNNYELSKPSVKKLLIRNIITNIIPIELSALLLNKNKVKIGDRIAKTDVYIVPRKKTILQQIIAGAVIMCIVTLGIMCYREISYIPSILLRDEMALNELVDGQDMVSYRFLLNIFRLNPQQYTARIDVNGDGTGVLYYEAYDYDTEDGYKIVDKEQVKLDRKDIIKFKEKIEGADFWKLPSFENRGFEFIFEGFWLVLNHSVNTYSGPYLAIEGVENGKYHLVERFALKRGAFKDLCLEFINLGGQDLNEAVDMINWDVIEDRFDFYTNDKYGFRIPYPKGWIVKEIEDGVEFMEKEGSQEVLRFTGGIKDKKLERFLDEKRSGATFINYYEKEGYEIFRDSGDERYISRVIILGDKTYVEFFKDVSVEFQEMHAGLIRDMSWFIDLE